MAQRSEKASDVSKRIRAKAEKAKATQIETIEELAKQGEQIKRTQNAVNDINRDLEKANAILRDMENPMSWIKGSGSKADNKESAPPPLPSDVQFDILRKKKWRFHPDKIIFTRGKFSRLRGTGEFAETVMYIAIERIVVNKDNSLVMSFKEGVMPKWTIKVVNAEAKDFVQELIRRAYEFCTGEKQIPVEFSPDVVSKFNIDAEKLKKAAPAYTEMYKEAPPANAKAELLSGAADDDDDDVDGDLKALSGILGDMKGLAKVQNTMITQQNAELDDLTGSVNHATDKLKSTNKRVAKQLK